MTRQELYDLWLDLGAELQTLRPAFNPSPLGTAASALKKLADALLAYDDNAIARVIASGTLAEVICDEKTIP